MMATQNSGGVKLVVGACGGGTPSGGVTQRRGQSSGVEQKQGSDQKETSPTKKEVEKVDKTTRIVVESKNTKNYLNFSG